MVLDRYAVGWIEREFIPLSSPPVIVAEMVEGKDTENADQAKDSGKRPAWWKRLWEWTEFGKKTGWNWLELLSALAIPVALAAAGFYFAQQQDERQRQFEADRADRERAAENRRAEVDRKIEERRSDDDALQAYLDQMSTLLLSKDLRSSVEDNATKDSKEARTLARARTLTVLGRMDSSRKTQVMQFLDEANLIRKVDGEDPVIRLSDADLSGADLSADLSGTDLSRADLSGADLQYAALSDADLELADLPLANLEYADLADADLGSADLSDANLHLADLSDAFLPDADLSDANLRYANLHLADLSEDDLRHANLSDANLLRADLADADLGSADLSDANLTVADLSKADLPDADLSDANLSDANLSKADLSDANLSDANLRYAYLKGSEGITNEELKQQASSLKRATMPNGQKYEDWLKDREGSKDAENE